PRGSLLFPYTTLFRSVHVENDIGGKRPAVSQRHGPLPHNRPTAEYQRSIGSGPGLHEPVWKLPSEAGAEMRHQSGWYFQKQHCIDRKSTRLNSSHVKI